MILLCRPGWVANIIFSKPIKREGKVKLHWGWSLFCYPLNLNLDMWLYLTNGTLASTVQAKLEKSLHTEIYPLAGLLETSQERKKPGLTLADVGNKNWLFPKPNSEMWVSHLGPTHWPQPALTDHDHVSEPRNHRRTTQLSPDQTANPTELWVNKWWMF